MLLEEKGKETEKKDKIKKIKIKQKSISAMLSYGTVFFFFFHIVIYKPGKVCH